tara:strand:+ start:290 stop:553 length:264 start_codon:yes stop_codon:yes gene_type:complete
MEKFNSDTGYSIGAVIQDDSNDKIYEVKKCEQHLLYDYYVVSILEMKPHTTNELLNDLTNALNSVKMHDKDLFMLENMVSSIRDSVE